MNGFIALGLIESIDFQWDSITKQNYADARAKAEKALEILK